MNGIKAYILCITFAAIFCCILLRIVGKKGTAWKIIRLLTGLFMTATVLSCVTDLDFSVFSVYPAAVTDQAEMLSGNGTLMANQAVDTIIIAETQAYILDKAASLGAELEVEVTLHEHIPSSVRISGAISPGAKERLSAWILENLNIPLEAQQWN